MNPILDPRSIAATVALSGFLLAAVLAVAHRDARHVPGVLSWMWSCIAVSLSLGPASLSTSLGPATPTGYVIAGFVIGSMLLNCALPMIWRGVRQFSHRSAPVWPIVAMAAFSAVSGYAFATTASHHHIARVLVFSILTALWCFAASYEFLRTRDHALRLGSYVAGLPLLLFGLLMLARAVATLWYGAPSSPSERTPVNNIAFLGGSLALMSTMIGIIICINARLASEIRRLAYEDMLTGALSRRGLYDALPRWLAKHAQGAAVALIDLDFFKSVNDKLGHAAGDELLRVLVATAKRHLPPQGLFARMGGDEFLLLLPANQPMEPLLQALAADFAAQAPLRLDLSGLQPKPDLSVGVAALEGADIAAFDAATRKADAALYCKKGMRGAPMRYLRSSDAQAEQQ